METPLVLGLAVLGLVWAASGVLLAMMGRLPGPPISATALTVAGVATLAAAVLEAAGEPETAHWLLVAAWAVAMPLAVTAYPRLRWRHPVDLVALVTVVGSGVLATLQPQRDAALEAAGVVIVSVLVLHTWWKLERLDVVDRRALAWVAVVGAAAILVMIVVIFVAPNVAGTLVLGLACALTGPAMVIGAARQDVLDVRVVVVQVVVVAVALISYIALFVGLAALLEIFLGSEPTVGQLSVLGGVAALCLPPLRTALRGVVDEVLFGRRSDPLTAATHVAGHSDGDPLLALRAVREALDLPYAVLRVEGEVVATSGQPGTNTSTVPLRLGPDRAGELEVGLRVGETSMSRADGHVLGLVAPLLALTARSSAMAADLQAAREQSVTAIEEERRRLQRDLHDGLGPRLSGIGFTADAALNSVRADPATAEALLARLRADTTTAIEEIRGLAYAMRPPALDELGLVKAIRQQALVLRTPSGAPLVVEVVAPDDLAGLTAAAEVAAYRIVVEALTNAARHSGSDRATVRITASADALGVEVLDGGRADRVVPGDVRAGWSAGVGVAGMRERAHELGGQLEAGPTSTGGRVWGRLPLADQASRPWNA